MSLNEYLPSSFPKFITDASTQIKEKYDNLFQNQPILGKTIKIFGGCTTLYIATQIIRKAYYTLYHKYKKYPPGPIGIPFFGCFFRRWNFKDLWAFPTNIGYPVRDRSYNTEQQRLINYPDPTRSAPATPADNTHLSYSNKVTAPKKSSVAERLAKFETNKPTKIPQKSKTKNKNIINKPKKKWIVKGIDDKNTYKTKNKTKKPINASNNIQQSIVYDEEPSVSMSHKERMKLYQQDVANVEQKEQERIQQHKQSRDGYDGVQVSSEQKAKAKMLLEQRVETQKNNDMSGITLSGDVTHDMISVKSSKKTSKKKRTLNELLKEATNDDARNIIFGMGFIQKEYNNKERREIGILNMNNNNMMSRLTKEQKIKFISLIGYSIIDINGNDKIERVSMCNTGIDDKLMIGLMKILVENKSKLVLNELWLESNAIGDDGMNGLCQLIECNLESLRVIKLYNNKKDVSTGMCNKMIDSLEKNDKIVKFTFEWRLQQQRDRMERLLKKNQELRRRERSNK